MPTLSKNWSNEPPSYQNGISKSGKLSSVMSSLRSWFLGVLGISFVVNILALTGPIFMLQVYDRVLVSGSVPTLITIGGLALVLYLFFGLLETLRARILLRMGQQVDSELSAQVFQLSNSAVLSSNRETKRSAPVQDLENVTGFMSGNGPAAIFDVPWLPFYLSIVFLFHSTLGYVALSGAVAICILVALNELVSRKPTAVAASNRSKRNSLVAEGRRNAETIKAMGMTGALSARWERDNDDHLQGQRVAADWSGLFGSAIKTIRFVLQSAILACGAWLAIKQEISPGVMIASSILTSRALAPVEQAVAHWRGFVLAKQSYRRLKNLMAGIPSEPNRTELEMPKERLEVQNIYCSPGAGREPVVLGASLELTVGDGVAIIGHSGSGKSTLVKAIAGIMDTIKGDVRLDGATLDQWSDQDRGRFVGYLPQDLSLFDGTIAQNISRFDANATSQEIIEAAKMADVHDLIVGLPDGYNTEIGLLGVRLSGGQQQRIALARALFRKPFLLVLDEPNSNLDAEGEAALAKALMSMRQQGSIIVLVAHRPQVLASVNKVLCLKEGRVVAFGPKDDVLGKTLSPVKTEKAA